MKKPLFLLTSSLMGGLFLCLAAPASAQETTPPPAASSPPPASNSSSMSGGAIGIGAEAFLSGLNGAEFVYDMSMFHVEAILGYDHVSNPNNSGSSSDFTFGVGGWYHLARGSNADFSIGGSVGLFYNSPLGGNSSTAFAIEPSAEARVFLSPNFALNARVGIAIITGDSNIPTTLSIAGQQSGTATGFGFTYFFR
jgi:hypothetical protein